MSFINDEVFDQGLDYAASLGSRIDICSQEPVTYTEAVATYTLGNKTGLTVGAAEDGAVDGRRVIVPAITNGSVTATATATHWALTDGAGILLATGLLAASQGVTDENPFTLAAFSITKRDPA